MLVLGAVSMPGLRAVDPLPPEIERAPLAVQAEFLRKRGEESDRLKRQVAQERFERREAERLATVTAVAEQADERRREIYAQTAAMGTPDALIEEESHLVRNLFLVGAAIFLLYRFRDRLLPVSGD